MQWKRTAEVVPRNDCNILMMTAFGSFHIGVFHIGDTGEPYITVNDSDYPANLAAEYYPYYINIDNLTLPQ